MRSRGSRSTVSGGGADTFERFTERARQVVVLAQDEARSLGHAFIAPEHLLLGLIREEDGIAARVLDSLGVTYASARADAVARHGEGDQVATGQIPFTPDAKKTLELSLREALGIGHNDIGTEHLLLGLARVRDDGELREAVLAAFSTDPGSPYDRAIDSFAGGDPWAERIEALQREGWEIMRITVQRRRRRG